jgi:cobalt-zinc-cadmium efflux system outer membrane protein
MRRAIPMLSVAFAACASSAPDADLDRVEGLSQVTLPTIAGDPDDLETTEDVKALLAEPLDAERAVKIALLNNRALRAELRELGIYRGQLVQAGLLPNPRFEFDLRLQEDRAQPLQADFLVEIDLTKILLLSARTGVADLELEAARFRAAGAVVELGYRARAAWYACLAADERLEIGRTSLASFAAGHEGAKALYAAGNIPELDLAIQEASYEDAQATVAELELESIAKKEALQRVLGLWGDSTEWKAAPLPEPPETVEVPSDLEKLVLDASLELQGSQESIDAVAKKAGYTRMTGWIPDISVDAHAEQDGTTWELGGGASIMVPLFDRQQGAVVSSEAELAGLIERYRGMVVDVRSAARETGKRLRTTHQRARQYRAVIVPARKKVTRQSQLQYNAMQLGVFRLLEVKREELAAQLAAITSVEDYWISRASLDALLAGKRVDAAVSRSGAMPKATGGGGH